MPLTEDHSAFFSVSEFASDAVLAGVAVKGIFDRPFALGIGGLGGFSTTQPVFLMPSQLVPPNPVGQTLTVDGVFYRIEAVEPDGTGLANLILQKQ